MAADYDLGDLLRLQAEWAGSHGSAMNRVLLAEAAREFEAGGIVTALLQPYERARRGDAVPLRFVGALHRLVLQGLAPDLARFYPSVGGVFEPDAIWPSARAALHEHRELVADILTRPPQTNEPGRGVALAAGLSWFTAGGGRPMPFRLFEIGSSAGLLLRSDRFAAAGMYDGNLPPWWVGPPEVVLRAGCDPDPVDPTTEDGRLTLMQYVWPDDLHRFDRLRLALDVAAEVPADVARKGAGEFVPTVSLAPGTATVLWHSVMWRYLPPDQRDVVLAHRAELARAATPDQPFLHVWFETEQADGRLPDSGDVASRTEGHTARVFCWDGSGVEGRSVRLGFGHPHGLPIAWDERALD